MQQVNGVTGGVGTLLALLPSSVTIAALRLYQATSALDVHTERRLFEALDAIARERTRSGGAGEVSESGLKLTHALHARHAARSFFPPSSNLEGQGRSLCGRTRTEGLRT